MARPKRTWPAINKEHLAREIAYLLDLTPEWDKGESIRNCKAYKIVTAIFKTIADALKKEDFVRINGFGTFYLTKVRAHKHGIGYFNGPGNLIGKGTINCPAYYRVEFRPSEIFKRQIKKGVTDGRDVDSASS
jgi:nucleoid DNA-binding protein